MRSAETHGDGLPLVFHVQLSAINRLSRIDTPDEYFRSLSHIRFTSVRSPIAEDEDTSRITKDG